MLEWNYGRFEKALCWSLGWFHEGKSWKIHGSQGLYKLFRQAPASWSSCSNCRRKNNHGADKTFCPGINWIFWKNWIFGNRKADSKPDFKGNNFPPEFSEKCGTGLPYPGTPCRNSFRWGSAANQACNSDRFGSYWCNVHSWRTFDRFASAWQSAVDRYTDLSARFRKFCHCGWAWWTDLADCRLGCWHWPWSWS